MRTFDIYCDASVSPSLRGACAGALTVERNSQNVNIQATIQPWGTNNSGEICGLLLGVTSAINIRESTSEPCRFNIFSDSIISIRGVREWIFGWIANANKKGNNILINSEGQPVKNQFYFKTIFNQIILSNLDVHFYHQPGHVTGNYGSAAYAGAAREFQKVNGIPLVRLGLTSEMISTYNNFIDGRTRDILREYLAKGTTNFEGISIDIIANTDYENVTATMVIPVINVMDSPIAANEQYNFAILNGKNIVKKYAELVHALDYPSKAKIMKYVS